MSQLSRSRRKELYEERLGISGPSSGLMDKADYKAAQLAIEEKLDNDDFVFRQQQRGKTDTFRQKLDSTYDYTRRTTL